MKQKKRTWQARPSSRLVDSFHMSEWARVAPIRSRRHGKDNRGYNLDWLVLVLPQKRTVGSRNLVVNFHMSRQCEAAAMSRQSWILPGLARPSPTAEEAHSQLSKSG